MHGHHPHELRVAMVDDSETHFERAEWEDHPVDITHNNNQATTVVAEWCQWYDLLARLLWNVPHHYWPQQHGTHMGDSLVHHLVFLCGLLLFQDGADHMGVKLEDLSVETVCIGCAIDVVNQVMSTELSMMYMSLCNSITIRRAFFLFVAIVSVSWEFLYSMMLET